VTQLGAARVTLLATTAGSAGRGSSGPYLCRYENAKYWQEYTDFAYHRLEVSGVYFIGGFGVMGVGPGRRTHQRHARSLG